MNDFSSDIEQCLKVLSAGELTLYPTDTIWGIGCDATNEKAVDKVFKLKQRHDSKTMIILVADEIQIRNYIIEPSPEILNYVSTANQPTTAVYEGAKNIAPNLINTDGTIAIRIVKDEFCAALIRKFKKPVVSTSANISGMAPPANFNEISAAIKNGVDYIVQHRQRDFRESKPSAIIRLNEEKKIIMIRP